MFPTGQEHTQPPCPYTLPTIFTKQTLSLSLTLGITSLALVLLLLLHIARHYHRRSIATTLASHQPYHHLSQMDAIEKGNISPMPTTPPPQSQSPPPPSSACDVLKPLSQSGVFPSSGAVAARARELMQMQMQKQLQTGKASPSSPAMMRGGSETEEADVAVEGGSRRSSNSSDSSNSGSCGGGEVGGSVQKRGELVQQIREVDNDGYRVRTWRRVVTEYS